MPKPRGSLRGACAHVPLKTGPRPSCASAARLRTRRNLCVKACYVVHYSQVRAYHTSLGQDAITVCTDDFTCMNEAFVETGKGVVFEEDGSGNAMMTQNEDPATPAASARVGEALVRTSGSTGSNTTLIHRCARVETAYFTACLAGPCVAVTKGTLERKSSKYFASFQRVISD